MERELAQKICASQAQALVDERMGVTLSGGQLAEAYFAKNVVI